MYNHISSLARMLWTEASWNMGGSSCFCGVEWTFSVCLMGFKTIVKSLLLDSPESNCHMRKVDNFVLWLICFPHLVLCSFFPLQIKHWSTGEALLSLLCVTWNPWNWLYLLVLTTVMIGYRDTCRCLSSWALIIIWESCHPSHPSHPRMFPYDCILSSCK